MDEVKRILALHWKKRTQKDIDYLHEHKSELTAPQLKQVKEFLAKTKPTVKKVEPEKKTIKDGKMIYAKFSTEIKDLGDGCFESIISSSALDRHGEKIDVTGLDLSKYKKNPVVMWGHNYDMPPIGTNTKLSVEGKKLIGRTQLFISQDPQPAEHAKFIKMIAEMIKGKVLNAVSIGFIPQEMEGNMYTKGEMIEYSVVPIPANADALINARKLGIDTTLLTSYTKVEMNLAELLKKLAEKGAAEMSVAEIKFLNDHKDELTVKQVEEISKAIESFSSTDEEAKKAVADLQTTVKELQDKLAAVDPIKYKAIGTPEIAKNINVSTAKTVSKEYKFLLYAKGLQSNNFKEYLDVVGKDAMNTSGNVVIPPVEFIAEIERLEEQYGAARQFVTIKRGSSGAGVKYILGDDDLEVFDTAEGGAKKSTKTTYQEKLLAWRKFAGILPITDELTEDSAVDLWADATNRFARAYAKQEDTLVFTNTAAGGNTKNGIIHETGTNVVHITGDSVQDVTYENLVDMIYGVPSPSGDTGRFFFNREMMSILMKLHDDNKRPIFLPGFGDVTQGQPATILGRPFTYTLVLPNLAADAPQLPFMVYGDLRFVTLGYRTDLQMKMFDSGIVGDPDEQDQDTNTMNLLTQDLQAMRAVRRMNAVVRFPAAFSVLKTGSGS